MSKSKERVNNETYEFSNFGSSFAEFSETPKHCESTTTDRKKSLTPIVRPKTP